jgi:hypothetical protein
MTARVAVVLLVLWTGCAATPSTLDSGAPCDGGVRICTDCPSGCICAQLCDNGMWGACQAGPGVCDAGPDR